LFFRDSSGDASSFKQMLYQKLGKGISERFLVPYNEKLYACDLDLLDKDAMGRFFPHAELSDIIKNMRHPDNRSYNSTFTYPEGGAIQYIHALLRDLPAESIALGERLESVDLRRKVARTSRREIAFDVMVSSAPLASQLRACGVDHDPSVFSYNKVLVFNLGFDKKGQRDVHWMYFPDRELSFYRVGWYDNIMDTERMSLYVEIGKTADAEVNTEQELERVLEDLRRENVISDQRLVSWHSVVLDPAYVHITQQSLDLAQRAAVELGQHGVYPVGRYGRWTYCSIEDNMVETRDLARRLAATE
jgi:protoporphyrinogen oxidase